MVLEKRLISSILLHAKAHCIDNQTECIVIIYQRVILLSFFNNFKEIIFSMDVLTKLIMVVSSQYSVKFGKCYC